MSLVVLDDINVHLPKDKLVVLEADDDALQLDVERIIKARLSGTFSPVTLASWTTPGTTPGTIQGIAGRLIAAFVYARAFASESVGLPEYAQWLYDQAMMSLDYIVTGSITLPEVTTEVGDTGSRFTQDFFWPNDSTSTEGRFTMQDVF